MAAPFFNLLDKADKAVIAYIVGEGKGTENTELVTDTLPLVVPGKASGVLKLPVVKVHSRNSKQSAGVVANTYTLLARISVRTQGSGDDSENQQDVPAEESADVVASIWDLFHIDGDQSGETLGTVITTAYHAAGLLDFTVLHARVEEIDRGFEAIGDAWADFLFLEMVCAPADDL